LLIFEFISVFILGCLIDSLVSKYFYNKIRKLEKDHREEIYNARLDEDRMRIRLEEAVPRIKLEEAARLHQYEIDTINQLYQANVAKLQARYGK